MRKLRQDFKTEPVSVATARRDDSVPELQARPIGLRRRRSRTHSFRRRDMGLNLQNFRGSASQQTYGEFAAALHGKVSSAYAQYLAGNPLLYWGTFETEPSFYGGEKPEGVLAEFAEAILMIVDYATSQDMDVSDFSSSQRLPRLFGNFIADVHSEIAFSRLPTADRRERLKSCVQMIYQWCNANGADLDNAILMVHNWKETKK